MKVWRRLISFELPSKRWPRREPCCRCWSPIAYCCSAKGRWAGHGSRWTGDGSRTSHCRNTPQSIHIRPSAIDKESVTRRIVPRSTPSGMSRSGHIRIPSRSPIASASVSSKNRWAGLGTTPLFRHVQIRYGLTPSRRANAFQLSPLASLNRTSRLEKSVGNSNSTGRWSSFWTPTDLRLPGVFGRSLLGCRGRLVGVDGRGNAHLKQRVDASRKFRRQQDEGVQPVATGFCALPPPLKLTGVHANATGQVVPGEAGSDLEIFESRCEVLQYAAGVDVEMGRYMTSSHDMTSVVSRSSGLAKPRAWPSRLGIRTQGRRGPGFDPGHVERRNDGHPRQSLTVKQSPHRVGTRIEHGRALPALHVSSSVTTTRPKSKQAPGFPYWICLNNLFILM